MKTNQEKLFFVLPEGATQEESWSWEAIEEMCTSGHFTPETRIFLAETNEWVRAGDTELKACFAGAGDGSKTEARSSEHDEEKEALEADYHDALDRSKAEPGKIEAHIEAGRLAADLGDRDAARGHFQSALELQPYNARVAQEIKRRFSKSECREFAYLQRETPVWENLSELFTYPLSRDIRYPAIPAAVTFVLLLVPFGAWAVVVLYFLWGVQVVRRAAAGSARPPLWHPALEKPVGELVLPFAAGALVTAEFVLFFYGIARLLMLASAENSVSAFHYLAGSPILIVLMSVAGIAYLPVVLVRLSHSVGWIVGLLDPWRNIKTAVRMEQEYAMSVVLLLALGLFTVVLNALVGGIPVLGKIILAALLSYTLPVAGLILGRLLARTKHLL